MPTLRTGTHGRPSPAVRATRGAHNEVTPEKGASTIELAILAPFILGITAIALETAFYFLTLIVTAAAAHSGAQSARGEYSTISTGIESANDILGALDIAQTSSVTGARTATDVTITVTATSPSLIPGFTLPPITSTSHGEVERVTGL